MKLEYMMPSDKSKTNQQRFLAPSHTIVLSKLCWLNKDRCTFRLIVSVIFQSARGNTRRIELCIGISQKGLQNMEPIYYYDQTAAYVQVSLRFSISFTRYIVYVQAWLMYVCTSSDARYSAWCKLVLLNKYLFLI